MVDKKTVEKASVAASKVLRLHLHKNKIENHRKRELAKDLSRKVEALVREKDIRAYAIVGIGADGQAYALWDTGACLPMWAFPDTIAYALREDIRALDIVDDWRPSLPLKGSE